MRTITLEEHYATEDFMTGPGRQLSDQAEAARDHPLVAEKFAVLVDRLRDFGEGRIAEMDAAGIDLQVLSLTAPGVEQLPADRAIPLACEANNRVGEAVRQWPDRFAGFAAIPMAAPDAAAKELGRTVDEYGFKGALINGHVQGRYLDDEFFWPVLECAEALGVPLYLHPTVPPRPVLEHVYAGNYSAEVMGGLATAAWGWHIDTATHVLRLILSGAFDRFPNLQLIVGHLGEALPFMLPRLDAALSVPVTKLDRA
ncbi:MAG: amidohydrolase family protein, partial [Actinoallomurus sp.]